MKDHTKNIYMLIVGIVFVFSVLFASVGAWRMYNLALDYIWQTETCEYPRIVSPEKEPVEPVCKYDGRSAARDATEAFALTIVLGLVAARSFKELKKTRT